MPTRLENLPAFKVQRIERGDKVALIGVFNHLCGVQLGESWLWAGEDNSLIGELVELDVNTCRAKFVAAFWTPASPVQDGSIAPWFDGRYQAYHVAMILDEDADWQRTKFLPRAAQHFRDGPRRGWTPMGDQLPQGAVPTHIDPTGWDHEHCEICMDRIGCGGNSHGYVNRHDRWLCERCYESYARHHDLCFLLEAE